MPVKFKFVQIPQPKQIGECQMLRMTRFERSFANYNSSIEVETYPKTQKFQFKNKKMKASKVCLASVFGLMPLLVTIALCEAKEAVANPSNITFDSANHGSPQFNNPANKNPPFSTPPTTTASPTISTPAPAGKNKTKSCSKAENPSNESPHFQAHWSGIPESVYVHSNSLEKPRIVFRNPNTGQAIRSNVSADYYFSVFKEDGSILEEFIPLHGRAFSNGTDSFKLSQPSGIRGNLKYRIVHTEENSTNKHYQIVEPCEFNVWFVDSSKPGIEISTSNDYVQEGGIISIIAKATPATKFGLSIPIDVSNSDRFANRGDLTIEIPPGESTGSLEISILNLQDDQKTDKISVAARPSTSYWLDDTVKSANFTIIDHYKPLVSFNADSQNITVEESESVKLTIVLSHQIRSDLRVQYELTEIDAKSGLDFDYPSEKEIFIKKYNTSGTISIPILDDTDFENNETFKVRLLEDKKYVLASNNEATVTIISDDAPEISHSYARCDQNTEKSENPSAIQTYWKEIPPKYVVANSNQSASIGFRNPVSGQSKSIEAQDTFPIKLQHIDGLAVNENIELVGHSKSRETEPFDVSDHSEFRGYLKYSISPKHSSSSKFDYVVGSPCEFQIWVVDSNRPGIILSIDEKYVVERNSFTVRATAIPEPKNDLVVPITFSGEFLRYIGTNQNITIKAGEKSGSLNVRTSRWPVDQKRFEITATAAWSGNYWLDDSFKSASVTMTKDPVFVEFSDESTDLVVDESTEILSLKVVASESVKDDVSIPVSIKSGTARENYDYLAPDSSNLIIEKGTASGNITVQIIPDKEVEFSEQFTVSIMSMNRSGIRLGTKVKSTVTILDDDKGVVAITAGRLEIIGGTDAEFTIHAIPTPTFDLPVLIEISQTGNSIMWKQPTTIVINAHKASKRFSIPTAIDRSVPQDSQIAVKIKSAGIYDVDSTKATVSVQNVSNANISPQKWSVVQSVIQKILLNNPGTARNTPERTSASIAAPAVQITVRNSTANEGDRIEFTISTTGGQFQGKLSVEVSLTAVGDFVNGELSRIVELDSERPETEIYVQTVDDNVAESDGSVTATILSGPDYMISHLRSATVKISDAADREIRKQEISEVNQRILPELTAVLGESSMDTTKARTNLAFNGTGRSSLELDGQSTVKGLLTSGAEMAKDGLVNWRSALGDTSFNVNLFPETGHESPLTVWGLGDHKSIINPDDRIGQKWDGEVFVGHAGFDTKLNRNFVAGLSFVRMDANLNFHEKDEDFKYSVRKSGVQPYFGYDSTDGTFQLRANAGLGSGLIGIEQNDYTSLLFDSKFYTAAMSTQQQLLTNFVAFGGISALNLSSNSWIAKQYASPREQDIGIVQTDVRKMQIALEENQNFELENGNSITQSVSLALRGSARNQHTDISLETNGKVSYVDNSGLNFSISSMSILDGLNEIREWNIQNTWNFDSASDGIGLQLHATAVWSGVKSQRQEPILTSSLFEDNFELNSDGETTRIFPEIRFGMPMLDESNILTPSIGMELVQGRSPVFHSAFRLESGNRLDLELKGTTAQVENTHNNKVHVSGTITW